MSSAGLEGSKRINSQYRMRILKVQQASTTKNVTTMIKRRNIKKYHKGVVPVDTHCGRVGRNLQATFATETKR